MSLPELPLQFVYARLAWALVLAALVVGLWPGSRHLPRPAQAGILGACLLAMALPGEASPAWHLGLAFQYPSGLLTALCVAKLLARWRAPVMAAAMPAAIPASMPTALAAALAVTGLVLYLDAFGLLAGGYYYAGFGPGAALCALLLAGACALATVRGPRSVQACAILGALLLFSLTRLPSGNLWDALIDPLLWGWALVSLVSSLVSSARRPRPRLGAAPFSPIKE